MQIRIAQEMKHATPEERRKIQKTVQREIQYIYTKGTHFKLDGDSNQVMGDYDAKHVLAFYQSTGNKFGYCYFDMSTLTFHLG
jgi:DNA mismatch repair ATPase MutS